MTAEHDIPEDLIDDISEQAGALPLEKPEFRKWFHVTALNHSSHGPYIVYEMPIAEIGQTFVVRIEGEQESDQRVFTGTIEGPGLNDRTAGEHGGTEAYFAGLERIRTPESEVDEVEVDLIYRSIIDSLPKPPSQ